MDNFLWLFGGGIFNQQKIGVISSNKKKQFDMFFPYKSFLTTISTTFPEKHSEPSPILGIFFLGGLGFSLQSWKSPDIVLPRHKASFRKTMAQFLQGRFRTGLAWIVFGDGDDLRGEKIWSRGWKLKGEKTLKAGKLLVNSVNSNH